MKSHSSKRHEEAISTSLNTARVNPHRVKRERSSRPWSKRARERKPQVSARTSRNTVLENPLVVTHSFSMSRSSSRHSGACTSMSATLLQRIARMVALIQSASVICTSWSDPPSNTRSLAATSLAWTPRHSQASKRVSPHVGSTRRRSCPGRLHEAAVAEGCLAQVGPREGAALEGAVRELRAAQCRVGEVAADERHVLDLDVLGKELHERLRRDRESLVGIVPEGRIARRRRHHVGAGDVEEGEGAALGERGDEGRAETGRLLVGHRPPHQDRGGTHRPDPGDALDGAVLRGIAPERLQLGSQVLGGLRELPLRLGSERRAEPLRDLRIEACAPRKRVGGRGSRLGVEPRGAMALASHFERGIGDARHRLPRRRLVLASVDGLRLLHGALRRRGTLGKGVLAGETRLVLRPGFRGRMARCQWVVGSRGRERHRHGVVERGWEEGAVVEPFFGVDPAAHRDLRPVVRIVGSGGGVLHPDDERPDLLPDPIAVGEPDGGAPDGGGDPGGGE